MSKKRAREIEVPVDALEDILVLLPPQPLLRFTCINKAWCSLIQSPSFISKLLLNGSSGSDHALLNLRSETSPGHKFSLLDSPGDLGNVSNVEDPCIVGHCHGLICFMSGLTKEEDIKDFDFRGPNVALHLWNPALRQHKILPESPILLPRPGTRLGSYRRVGLGFGHDPRSRDYKVVRCAFYPIFLEGIHYTGEYEVEAEVYSLRTDSWRPVATTQLVLKSLPATTHGGVYLGGFCYWMCYKSFRGSMIISYDMSKGVFRQFHVPEQMYRCRPVPDRVCLEFKLLVWKGSLAIVLFPTPTRPFFMCPDTSKVTFLDIWSLEIDIDGRVTLKEHLDFFLDIDAPLRLMGVECLCNDDLIIRCHDKSLHISETRFKAYRISTRQIRNISLVGTYSPNTRMVGYTPSLISLLT